MAVTEAGCSLSSVNFCPRLGVDDQPHSSFSGVIAPPDAPIQYTDVGSFYEYLRTTAVLNGDHAVRRAWVACLRGAAHFWFYHSLSMGARKHLADASPDEVIQALMSEFGHKGKRFPDAPSATGSDKALFPVIGSGLHGTWQPSSLSVPPAPGPPAPGPPAPGPPASNLPCPPTRSLAGDEGLFLAGHCFDDQFNIRPSLAAADALASLGHRYPTHQDVIRQRQDTALGRPFLDQAMADAPRFPRPQTPAPRSTRQRTPTQRSPIGKIKRSLNGKACARRKGAAGDAAGRDE